MTKSQRAFAVVAIVVIPMTFGGFFVLPFHPNGPIIAVDTTHFSGLPVDGHVQHQFLISNLGNAPLQIKEVKSSCGCTVATLKNHTIEPGKIEFVNVDLHVTEARSSSSLVVVTNSIANGILPLTIASDRVVRTKSLEIVPTVRRLVAKVGDKISGTAILRLKQATKGNLDFEHLELICSDSRLKVTIASMGEDKTLDSQPEFPQVDTVIESHSRSERIVRYTMSACPAGTTRVFVTARLTQGKETFSALFALILEAD